MIRLKPALIPAFFLIVIIFFLPLSAPAQDTDIFTRTVETLSALKDRSTGTDGCGHAAEYIRKTFEKYGLEPEVHKFCVPVRNHGQTALTLPGQKPFPLSPLIANAIAPQTITTEGISGPLIYVKSGKLDGFNGKQIDGAIVLMELDSGKNWLHAAEFGAKALIYIDRGKSGRDLFEDKYELSPIRFPRFLLTADESKSLFGDFENAPDGILAPEIRLHSDLHWENVETENIYALIPGTDQALSKELVILEAFYDSMAWIPGKSPGADEACSIAALLEAARFFRENPPKRSLLLVATAGHAQSLAGMREMIRSIRVKSDRMKEEKKGLEKRRDKVEAMLDALDRRNSRLLPEALEDRIKTETDSVSRKLMALRMVSGEKQDRAQIARLAAYRLKLRQIGWKETFEGLTADETAILEKLVPEARKEYKAIRADIRRQIKHLKSAKEFRNLVKDRELKAVVSLHLSSHGDGLGAFNEGWLYPVKGGINRASVYSALAEVLEKAASGADDAEKKFFRDTLRPNPRRTWQSWFADRPPLGGEVSALAGYPGLTLVTVQDARPAWGTPSDIPSRVNFEVARIQARLVCRLVQAVAADPALSETPEMPNGFAEITGRAKRLRHGELFPDQTAPDTVILAWQGAGIYHAMADASGIFQLKGVATKKLVPDKVVIEGYRFDPETGETVLAIDKKDTGISAYRLKIQRRDMETDLVMFPCRQTTLFNLLEPLGFRYMSKIQLFDGRRDSLPLHYWYSRIDTRASTITSVCLEPGTFLKLTHSDTLLRKKMILTNSTPENPSGRGYRVDDWSKLTYTGFRTARDMWHLLNPRIENLERHGIHDDRISGLQKQGLAALDEAENALEKRQYDRFSEAASRSWALASRVYSHVDETQKDVLFGVLFYIALFVPFAFCSERLLFGFSNIHKRISAFTGILLALVAVIYRIHPAFELAYSPTVVILAFFIMGLSLMVTLIIFFRFEEEMTLLQRRATRMRAEEISRWKAFTAAFFLGVSNLRRRRLRTALTCTTLVILTFTIMSFTSVKSARFHARQPYRKTAHYQGFLLKNVNWNDLPPEALSHMESTFGQKEQVVPRVWLEDESRTRSPVIPMKNGAGTYEARGLVGLSAHEPEVTGMDRILRAGRWFRPDERNAVMISEQAARALGIRSEDAGTAQIQLWGEIFTVTGIFSGTALQETTDLDGEPLTPVTFPSEVDREVTDAELEAMESGDDVQTFQSRYEHIPGPATIIIPARTLMARGGRLKGVAARPGTGTDITAVARRLSDRFSLTLFSGEPDGTFIYTGNDTLSYSGMPNIIIPLLISVCIVLNTMIGSVYERKREIGIYTSVGLAPSHVSFLFIAESLAFGVLSVVLGYMAAQISAGLFAGTALWAGITVNYSSLAGVAAMMLVILVVLVSVIYPSGVAADIAIPDVNRSWSLPEADDNSLELALPFLVKYHEHDSIAGFMLAWFQDHRDVSHGLFSTGDVHTNWQPLFSSGDGPSCIFMDIQIWLAPFDFGIRQQARIHFCPSVENAAFMEISVKLVRESGEANAWKRVNRAFINQLRKQLLVWRSLDDAGRKSFAHRLNL